MYVHIGKDMVINSDNIIAILDIESLEKKKKLEEVLQNLKISDKIIDVSEGNKKSLIILKKIIWMLVLKQPLIILISQQLNIFIPFAFG